MAKQQINQSQQPNISRQDNTTNTSISGSRIETGWGWIQYDTGSNAVAETVTFGTPYVGKPIVLVTFGGDTTSTTNYGDGGNTAEASVIAKAYGITNSSFIVRLNKQPTGNFIAGTGFYQWIAIGV